MNKAKDDFIFWIYVGWIPGIFEISIWQLYAVIRPMNSFLVHELLHDLFHELL